MKVLTGVCAIVAMAVSTPALAQMKQTAPASVAGHKTTMAPTKAGKPKGPRSVKVPGKLNAAPLTKMECMGLGGRVVLERACAGTGEQCATVNKYGVIHRACITAK